MSIPEIDPLQIDVFAEAQLQQELRSLFLIDTQTYLQTYNQIAQQLQSQTWKADIQELYRCIHTIKGSAVTVAAEAILMSATALEDLLADLRYLETAPDLTDSTLSQALLEASELLTSTLDLEDSEEAKPLLQRIQALHAELQAQFLPHWNEQQQLHQEFAEQGLDMVVLELEIALERLSGQGNVPQEVILIAQQTLAQLHQIGEELTFAEGWTALLNRTEALFAAPEKQRWRSHWLQLFQALKVCAKQGGNPVEFEFSAIDEQALMPEARSMPDLSLMPNLSFTPDQSLGEKILDFDITDLLAHFDEFETEENWLQAEEFLVSDGLPELEDSNPLEPSLLDSEAAMQLPLTDPVLPDFSAVQDWTIELNPEGDRSELDFTPLSEPAELLNFHLPPDTQLPQDIDLPQSSIEQSFASLSSVAQPSAYQPFVAQSSILINSVSAPPRRMGEKAKIPVALEQLDQSAQDIVETLLAVRMSQGLHHTLQNQITHLTALAQEGIQYISQLRQIQNDYALLDQLSSNTSVPTQGPTPERYRQGYVVINRLLEINLRLFEMGAEAEKYSQQVTENLSKVDNQVLKLQNTLEDSRLIPFRSLGLRAKAILRDLTTRYHKPAQLRIYGEETELDVGIVRELEPALLHLIRNAYDHGLETPEERVRQGKPPEGCITLSLQRQGNLFQFKVADDGCGISARAIQARAMTLGLPLTRTQTPAELLAVLCQPGFSSRMQVGEVSGRGVGMDVVAAQVARLGGKLSLYTVSGTGTTFQLQFPTPRLLVPCVLIQAGEQTLAIPADDIRTTTLLSNLNASQIANSVHTYSWIVQDETGLAPALDLLEYWQPRSAKRLLTETTVCLHIQLQDSAQRMWLMADELLEQAELLINPLPSPLVIPTGLMGISLQANGQLIPVLDARALVEQLLFSSQQETEAIAPPIPEPQEETDPLSQTILIVDDAALVRRRLEASLSTYGYVTQCCSDGREAWNWLQEHPDHLRLIITDIEMPNMDGFTLIDRCRQRGITAPILVISSRLSEDWSNEAKRLGANDYLTKGFSTVELINKVNSLLR